MSHYYTVNFDKPRSNNWSVSLTQFGIWQLTWWVSFLTLCRHPHCLPSCAKVVSSVCLEWVWLECVCTHLWVINSWPCLKGAPRLATLFLSRRIKREIEMYCLLFKSARLFKGEETKQVVSLLEVIQPLPLDLNEGWVPIDTVIPI